MAAMKGRIVSGGRLQIPADVRRELGLVDGDDVRLEVVDGELRVRSFGAALARVRALVSDSIAGDDSLADDLIANRRAEAARD